MNEKIDSQGSKPGRRKSSQGLQATLERLTGRTPCPAHWRNAANQYLATELFQNPDVPGRKLTNERKLALPGAEALLMNALTLDEVFRGEVKPVVAVLTGAMGDAYDNAMAESFFASLGGELIERNTFHSKAQASMAVFTWIEGWYNPRRRHSGLGFLSPLNIERSHETLFDVVENAHQHVDATPETV